ncbi:uncharacterized protein BDZ99DRAFT_310291 [Mytilinidion resinicola]|uniref:Uncharacterized protein n=1 Tax=Mytilinidion resinicola TaxID=574789 RepID=A0A6A6YQW2_9PEZI|nr:uncharacterized protein BDZ99DRAFT_310291 [Mytilinidion resinicola]KAF2810375.1 hypothetical protein BDZ99DRAFT_310291 [Mytilinidion resinicola]
MALLRKRQKLVQEVPGGQKKKRNRLLDFFKSRRRNTGEQDEQIAPPQASLPRQDTQQSKHAEPLEQTPSDTPKKEVSTSGVDNQPTPEQLPTPPPDETVSEKDLRTLFSGAPQYTIISRRDIPEPTASCPWDSGAQTRNLSDSLPLSHPAFSAATLRPHVAPFVEIARDETNEPYVGYNIDVVEVPSMLSANGVEPGTVGFDHFLQLPISDNLDLGVEEVADKNGLSEDVRNRELLHNNPERLGIRSVDSVMIYERLVEFGELWLSLRQNGSTKTILDKQSSGDMYANLFGKFLSPPRFDADTLDPTGLKVQIETLLNILRLKGIWFDFSLVEWRIRLGQVLWTAADAAADDEPPNISNPEQTWSDRDILLLQISLSCELLVRLDAISVNYGDDTSTQVTAEELRSFTSLKSRKTDWDLVLARRFLENVQAVITTPETPRDQSSSLRGFFSAVLAKPEERQAAPEPDVLLLPRHQSLQLSGLLHFVESLQWPNIDLITDDLSHKLAIPGSSKDAKNKPSGLGKYLDPATPTSPSIYSTPLASPRSAISARNSYFGTPTKRPALSRDNTQRSVQLSPSATLFSSIENSVANPLDIGGWLSRAYLTGLILPGEAISHFLISTLLENDKLAISALGDTASLYGGFLYAERCWWSKTCVIGRVLSCIDGAVECMGWISIPRLPSAHVDGWVTTSSKQPPPDKEPLIKNGDRIADVSAVIPGMDISNVKPEDLVLPLDLSIPPLPSIHFIEWSLAPSPGADADANSLSSTDSIPPGPPSTATLIFSNLSTSHTLTLTHDISFISSFPCIPPANPNARLLSRTASKRITLARRSSHGFNPLASHPPDTESAAPRPSVVDAEAVLAAQKQAKAESEWLALKGKALPAHPLHASYKYRVVSVADVLEEGFEAPVWEEGEDGVVEVGEVLVLDARGEWDLELLARAWCAERGVHAIIGRVGRSCIGCCVREARGLGVRVVVRV